MKCKRAVLLPGAANWCREKCKEELPLLQEIEPGHKVACFHIYEINTALSSKSCLVDARQLFEVE